MPWQTRDNSALCSHRIALHLIDSLHHHGGRSTAAVADSSNTILTRLELMEQCSQDARARTSKRMTQRDGATQRVYVGILETKNLYR